MPPVSGSARLGMRQALSQHWPEYLMEAAGLGCFMISACFFGALLEFPGSPVHQAIPSVFLRRVLMGLAMGSTSAAIIYSPWGKQSGAHLNPSVTLTFLRLGKVKAWDAFFYVLFQFLGGVTGVALVAALLGQAVAHPAVRYVVTVPGMEGILVALTAEFAIAFGLMSLVLTLTNLPRWEGYTGLCAGALVAAYIAFEAPFSGMSMNPARTLSSAVSADLWNGLWIYFTAPPLGMLAAAEIYLWLRGRHAVGCAKLHHRNDKRCIFCGKPAGQPA
ncbi:MAG: MIP/aquaporin family protein [Terriglobales bacterium]